MKNYIPLIATLAIATLAARADDPDTASPRAAGHDATFKSHLTRLVALDTDPGGTAVNASDRALVIPKEAGDTKAIADVTQDLNIMARILTKATSAGADKGREAMGIAVHSAMFGGGGAPRNLYFEGYGAVFFLNVNYPLLPPPAKKAEAEAKDETSTEWDEARRELNQSQTPGFNFNWPQTMDSWGSGAVEQYDAEKVETLKTELVSALKNAAHIRGLKSDEGVTVVVFGRGGSGETRTLTRRSGSDSGGGGSSSGSTSGSGSGVSMAWATSRAAADSHGGKLILRAKKADIDAFRKDKISLEEFRKKVSVILF